LGMITVENYLASLRLKVFLRALCRTDLTWANYVRHRLSSCTGNWKLSLEELLMSAYPTARVQLPEFWKMALKDWQKLFKSSTPLIASNLLAQPLFHNSEIKLNGRTLSATKWLKNHEGGLRNVGDLWQGERWKTIQEIRRDCRVSIRNKTKAKLISCIPVNWIQEFGEPQEERKLNLAKFANYKTAEFREKLTTTVLPKAIKLWPEEWKIPWRKVWSSLRFIPDRKMADVHFKLLHRALPVGENIQKWKPAMDHPCGCNYPLETHQHLFSTCPYSLPTWKLIDSIMSRLMKDTFVSSAQTRITGVFPCSRSKRKVLSVWRILFSCAIHAIWISRCSRIMDRKEVPPLEVRGTAAKLIRRTCLSLVTGLEKQRCAKLIQTLSQNDAVLLQGSQRNHLTFHITLQDPSPLRLD